MITTLSAGSSADVASMAAPPRTVSRAEALQIVADSLAAAHMPMPNEMSNMMLIYHCEELNLHVPGLTN